MKPDEDIRLLYIDLFCGAGGTSTGVENAVVDGKKIAKVIACVNHDANAIASHKANHPDAVHYTEDIRTLQLDPMVKHVELARKTYPKAKVVLWASLECTNFSRAKGGMSRDADSRTLAEHLYRYIEAIKPDIIQAENVFEILTYGPLIQAVNKNGKPKMVKKTSGKGKDRKSWYEPAMMPDPEHAGEYFWRWVRKICSYGYTFEYRILNSADYGAYTSRKRFFGMFVSEGIPMVFPAPTHAKDPQRTLFGEQLQPWKAVREVLDLKDEGVSIFDRKKPLVDATLRRILAGLKKFVAKGDTSFLTKAFGGNPDEKCSPTSMPSGAITTVDHHQFITTYYGRGGAHSIERPAPTITTKDRLAMVYLDKQYDTSVPASVDGPCPTLETVPKVKPVAVHFLDNQYGQSRCSSVDAPSGTITVNPKQALVEVRPWLMLTNYQNVGSDIDEPAKTLTADRHWAYLLSPKEKPVCNGKDAKFITNTYSYVSDGYSIDNPAPTVIARQDKAPLGLATARRSGSCPSFVRQTPDGLLYEVYDTDSDVLREIKLFMAAYGIVDITMRMLRIKELKLIQGFPEDYILVGTQEEQKKYLGNAVVTIMAKVWCEAMVRAMYPLEFVRAA